MITEADEIVLVEAPKIKENPSQELLRECFDYREGKLFWKARPRSHFSSDKGWKTINGRDAGKVAGSLKSSGLYYEAKVCDKCIYIHCAIWIWHHGAIPNGMQVDHINENSLDNRIENLRICTPSQNMFNRSVIKTKKSGLPKGVFQKGRNFMAEIRVNKKRIYLGTYKTPEEAGAKYQEAAFRLHGEFARFEATPST